jgi:stage VI sporulation protein D
VSDQTNGLRFDVYERVHLPEHVAAIEELEEIELFPRIQVIDQGDQAVLKGQLVLSGVYRGQDAGEAPLALQHEIPVEITLPMNRISRLDDILIEIDNFDVDLLSARTLNITGVLSLRGIAAEAAEEQEEAEAWREEPFTVVHQREVYEQPPFVQPYITGAASYAPRQQQFERNDEVLAEQYDAQEADAEEEPSGEQWLEASADAGAEAEPEALQAAISSTPVDYAWSNRQQFEAGPGEQAAEDFAQSEEREITLASQQSSDEGWLASSSPFAVSGNGAEQLNYGFDEQAEERVEAADPDVDAGEAQAEADFGAAGENPWLEPEREPEPEAEKQEVRIAFAGKPPEERGVDAAGVGFSTLLQTSRREQAARQAAEDIETQELKEARAQSQQATGDEIEWKNLFLGNRTEDQEFRKIRMCIVQRDETLDAIASRYSLNPREILLYNRMEDNTVAEGQLLYIP